MNKMSRMMIATLLIGFGIIALAQTGRFDAAYAGGPLPSTSAKGRFLFGFAGSQIPFGRGDARGSLNQDAALTWNNTSKTLGATNVNATNVNATNVNATAVSAPSVVLNSTTNGLKIKEGTNARMGSVALSGPGWVTVETTAVGANSRIFVTGQNTTGALYVKSRVAGTSFDIYSTDVADEGTAAWVIVDPAP